MSWKIIEKHRKILAVERGAVVKGWGGKLTVCLVYPNRYRTAMSNLGFQTVYSLLNDEPDVLCERAFVPDPEESREYEKSGSKLLSLESQRPLAEFDLIAFSVSFESDYLNIPAIFKLAGLPASAADRDASHPLVMGGGAALFLNPEPVADFMDMVCVGEAEPILPKLLELLRHEAPGTRHEVIRSASSIPGIYVPSLYEVDYDGPRVISFRPLSGAPATVRRMWEDAPDRVPTVSVVLTPDTEFGDMHLVEVSRGCPRGCRFCAAGFIYLPYRQRSFDSLREQITAGLEQREKIGLVGAAVSDHRELGKLCAHIMEQGGKVSVSSLRIDRLDDAMIEALKQSGHKTVALAPEGGSQRLRDLINKNIDEAQILAACDRLIGHDILNLKLYFIIGLPTETDADIDELIALVERIRARVIDVARARGRLGEVVLSVNPFVPKPFTPFQWCGMEDVKSLDQKGKRLQQAFGRLSNVRLSMESPKDAYLQAMLSRGDRRLGRLLIRAAELGSWKRAARDLAMDSDPWAHRNIMLDEILPWDFIESVPKERLVREYQKAFEQGS